MPVVFLYQKEMLLPTYSVYRLFQECGLMLTSHSSSNTLHDGWELEDQCKPIWFEGNQLPESLVPKEKELLMLTRTQSSHLLMKRTLKETMVMVLMNRFAINQTCPDDYIQSISIASRRGICQQKKSHIFESSSKICQKYWTKHDYCKCSCLT